MKEKCSFCGEKELTITFCMKCKETERRNIKRRIGEKIMELIKSVDWYE